MRRANPLVLEALRGIPRGGRAQNAWLGYLALQGLALFLWWPPEHDLYHVLATGNPPDTLTAVVVALGATLAYYSLRAGAEELPLPGQHPLAEWVLGTPLSLPRILRGYLGGHLLQSLHAVALSSPLLLAAFSVSGASWAGIGWSLATVLAQAAFYRLVGALLHCTIGRRRTLTLVSLRAALLLGYAVTPFLLPAANHPMVAYRLFNPPSTAGAPAFPEALVFVLLHVALCAAAALALGARLARLRRGARAGDAR